MSDDNLPFLYGRPVRGEHFTGREAETERLRRNLLEGVHTVLTAPRRLGKTSLVGKVLGSITADPSIRVAKLSALGCRTPSEFLEAYASAVTRAAPDAIYPDAPLPFDAGVNVDDVLNLPEALAAREGFRMVVFIDECQRIAALQDAPDFLERLRTAWCGHKHASYCLVGTSAMEAMFRDADRTFHGFGDVIRLQPIPKEQWVRFIVGRFDATGKRISEAHAAEIAESVRRVSGCVQHLAAYAWAFTDGTVTDSDIENAKEYLISTYRTNFRVMTAGLSARQRNLLLAVADGTGGGCSDQRTICRYRLGPSSTVARSKAALLGKDLLLLRPDGSLGVADPLLEMWLKTEYRPTVNL